MRLNWSLPLLLATLLLATLLPAQVPGPAPTWTHDPAPEEPAGVARRLGDAMFEAGDHAAAAEHYLRAQSMHPASRELQLALLRASGEDPAARALWAHSLAALLADAKGRLKLDRAQQELFGPDAAAAVRLAQARADAAAELLRFAEKLKPKGSGTLGNDALARWAAATALPLLQESPALLTSMQEPWRAAIERLPPDHATVLAALKSLMDQSAAAAAAAKGSNGDAPATGLDPLDAALRAARCLTGLAAQAEFKDLEGPPPPEVGDLARQARQVRQRLRERKPAGDDVTGPLTVDELLALTPAEQLSFTRSHASWANPGVAVSPNGRYVIETTCGYETLLGAAQTVELHHARLVAWFGKDPFLQQPGLVRIVPDADDLEAEDSPFWWAGGFQAGHVTHLQFHWSTIEDLGRGLTHELTHRFDGTLLPFLPSWAVEGRAVWTGKAYGAAPDPQFAEPHLDPWAAQEPFVKGYGRKDKLQELIEGTIDDYRDNYSAGYALFSYLRFWAPDGQPLFADALERFLRHARAGREQPLAFFEKHFCDGKQGRPENLDAFCAGFEAFLRGCYDFAWGDREKAPWMSRYLRGLRGPDRRPLVLDEETFTWSRARAEPWFGQDHARRAGRLLAEHGKAAPAAAALLWSIRTDEWSVPDMRLLAELLHGLGQRDAAWAVRHENARLGGTRGAPQVEAAPFLGALPRTRALLALLAELADAHGAGGRVHAAAVLADRHDQLAAALGTAPLPARGSTSNLWFPRPAQPRALGTFGWIEDGLTDYEERRVRDLWFQDHSDLHVGRSRPRDQTGLLDRAAHQRHAFVRSQESFRAGRYVLRTRVHFTTSFVSGCVVLGLQRRDRNLRLRFSAGNFLYSIGRSEDAGKTDKVSLRIDGLRSRGGRLPGSHPGTDVEFEQPSSWFDLELRIAGPCVHVHVNGEHRFTYATPDGAPIEGAIGFAMGQGAVRLQEPTVQVLEERIGGTDPGGVALLEPEPGEWARIVHRAALDVPYSEQGSLLLWLPPPAEAERLPSLVQRYLDDFAPAFGDQARYPQRWVLVVPAGLSAPVRAELDQVCKPYSGRVVLLEARRKEPFVEDGWLLFADGHGILRSAQKTRPGVGLVGAAEMWARRWRRTTLTR